LLVITLYDNTIAQKIQRLLHDSPNYIQSIQIAIPVSCDFWAIAFGEVKGKVAIAIPVSRDY